MRIYKSFFAQRAATLAALLLLPACALAQQGKLSGEVRDPHQAAVAGAKVTVTNLATNKSTTVKTDAQGEYSLGNLTAGDYSVAVEAAGFKSAKNTVKVGADGAATQNLSLALGAAVEQVEVHDIALNADLRTQTAALIAAPESVKENTIEITAKDIQNLNANNLIDVLQTVPGFTNNYQGRQNPNFMSMRGGSLSFVLDGAYLGMMNRTVNMIPLDMIESITVVRNATALTLGPAVSYSHSASTSSSSPVGSQGYVFIRTKRSKGPELSTIARGGNWETALGGVTLGEKLGPWDFRLNYQYSTSGGRDGWNLGYRNGSIQFHTGYTSNKLNWEFTYFGSRGQQSFEADFRNYPNWVANLNGSGQPGWDWSVLSGPTRGGSGSSFNIFYAKFDTFTTNAAMRWNDHNRTLLQYSYGFYRNATQSPTNENQNREGSVDLKHTYDLKGNKLTGGSQFIKYLSYNQNTQSNTALFSWYGADEYSLLHNRLTLDAGIRSDKLWNYSPSTSASSVLKNKWGPANYIYTIGGLYKITPKVTASARYGHQSMPAPSNWVAPTGLTLPSSLTQHRTEFTTNAAVNPHLTANLSSFVYVFPNGVTAANGSASAPWCAGHTTASWTGSAANEDPTVTYYCYAPSTDTKYMFGGDISLSGKLLGPVSYSAVYAYQDYTGLAMNAQTRHTGSGQVNYRQKQYFANFGVTYRGAFYNAFPGTVAATGTPTPIPNMYPLYKLAGYTLFNLNGGVDFKVYKRAMTLTGGIGNLSDNNYYAMQQQSATWPNPGRTFNIQLTTKLFPPSASK